MSLETKIEALTGAVLELVNVLRSQRGADPVLPSAPVVVAAPAAPAPPVAQATIPATPAMPPAPDFLTPPAAQAPAGAPFTDMSGLRDYAMTALAFLESQQVGKGHKIQEVLTAIGVANINSVQPAQYAAFYQGVEALKA
jgi:hypothetical protein